MTDGSPHAANLADLLRLTAQRQGDHVALIHDDESTTWADLDREVDQLASGLQQRGVGDGDRVVMQQPTSVEFIKVYFAVLRAGGVAVPINTGSTTGEVARVLADSGAKFFVAAGQYALVARSAVAGVADALTDPPAELADRSAPKLIFADGPVLADEIALAGVHSDDAPAPTRRAGEDLAVLLYTSGTSGRPRAAMLSHRAMLANISQTMQVGGGIIKADDVVLAVLPFFHVYGLNGVLATCVRVGATMVVVSRFDPASSLALIGQHHVTVVPAAPPVLVAWSSQPNLGDSMTSVRLIFSGSAALPVSLLEEIHAATGIDVHEGYGLTEAAPVVATTLVGGRPLPGSVGQPLPGVEVRLLDDGGHEAEEGDPGEITIRGENLFSGYWPDGHLGPDADGWWRTGDVAYQDDDGTLTLVDRVKDLVIVSGFNVYPHEVEDVIEEVEGVAEAAVISVAHPYTGEAVKAFVQPKPGSTVTIEQVNEHCEQRLARFKRPTQVVIVHELPHTPTGKVAKGRLRAGEARIADGIV